MWSDGTQWQRAYVASPPQAQTHKEGHKVPKMYSYFKKPFFKTYFETYFNIFTNIFYILNNILKPIHKLWRVCDSVSGLLTCQLNMKFVSSLLSMTFEVGI